MITNYFEDINDAFDKFNLNLVENDEFYKQWYRPHDDDCWIKGGKVSNNQLKAFFEWYVDDFGGQAIPF